MSKKWNSYLAFKGGEHHAFASLYQRFKKPIFKYVSARIAELQLAEEVTQEIFVKVFRFRESYDEKHEISTWLWTIARNTVFDTLRKQQGQTTEHSVEVTCPDDIASPIADAQSMLEQKDQRRLLKMTLKSLTRMQRRVVWMRVVQQKSYSEISTCLGLSLAAKNLAFRAKRSLKHGVAAQHLLMAESLAIGEAQIAYL
jgi:RNA polymerase sigma-70 factor (ECF subfamily)